MGPLELPAASTPAISGHLALEGGGGEESPYAWFLHSLGWNPLRGLAVQQADKEQLDSHKRHCNI